MPTKSGAGTLAGSTRYDLCPDGDRCVLGFSEIDPFVVTRFIRFNRDRKQKNRMNAVTTNSFAHKVLDAKRSTAIIFASNTYKREY
jgi:hypothetical protein